MQSMLMHTDSLAIGLPAGPAIGNITPDLLRMVQASGISLGHLNATMIGSTGSLTAIEFESGVIQDLIDAINRLAPPDGDYAHEEAWHDGNGHSHVQAAIIGPSINLPVRDGRLRLGTWQQVVAINHDNRRRTRTVEVTIMGLAG